MRTAQGQQCVLEPFGRRAGTRAGAQTNTALPRVKRQGGVNEAGWRNPLVSSDGRLERSAGHCPRRGGD